MFHAETLARLTKTSQLRPWPDPFEHDHRLPSPQSVPLPNGNRVVWRIRIHVWYHKLHRTCPCSFLLRCCRGSAAAGSRIPDGVLVYPQGDGDASRYLVHWPDTGFLHGWADRCCCFWDSRPSKCFSAIPRSGLKTITTTTLTIPLQSYGIAGWKWLFIVLAVCGTGLALVALFLLPDYPHSQTGSAMWTMTEDMRKIAAARIAADRVSTSEAKSGVWEGLKMAIFDWKMVLLVALNIGISAAYGFSNFFPSIVRGFGYSNVVSLLLTCPPYIFAAIGSLINAWHSDRTSERGYHFAGPIAVGCIGYIICLSTMNGGARYGASFLYVGGMYTANPLISTWVSSTMGRTPENRAIAVALCNVLGQIGNVIAPYFFRESDNPRYQLAFILMMVCAVVAISATMGLKFHLRYLNKKLYQKSLLQGTVYQPYVT
jgi:hypothetical protein